jgi:predicted MFS family arabinose efflux permease
VSIELSARRLRILTFLLAVASGATIANIFYSQPLLGLIGSSFGISESAASIVVTVTQLGYAAGILMLMPLGDLLNNRKLASRVLILTAIAAAMAVLAPTLPLFLVASVVLGFTSVVAQIVIPFVAHLAPAGQGGRYVGRVMSGLLLGIMLARSVSSFSADAWGWRSVYAISAVAMLIIAVLLAVAMPDRKPDHTGGYASLLLSIGRLIRTEPALRRRALLQALMFATFSAFWTSIASELIADHRLTQWQIAIFALVGAAGSAAAPIAGRIGDRGLGRPATGVVFALAAVAMAVAGLVAHNLAVLALAAVLLDVAVQGSLILSQQEIYALRPDARSRLNTVFIASVFLGGAIGSGLSGVLYGRAGWTGVAWLGVALAAIGLVVWGGSELGRRPSQALAAED